MPLDGRAARGIATRELILDTAMDLFRRFGYKSTSVRDIAARAGITHPGLLYHFPTKEALLMAVLQRRDELDCDPVELPLTGRPVPARAPRARDGQERHGARHRRAVCQPLR